MGWDGSPGGVRYRALYGANNNLTIVISYDSLKGSLFPFFTLRKRHLTPLVFHNNDIINIADFGRLVFFCVLWVNFGLLCLFMVNYTVNM